MHIVNVEFVGILVKMNALKMNANVVVTFI